MRIFVLTATYELRVSRKNHLRDHPRKYVEEKMMATLNSKQTSIATVRYHLLPVASLLTPLIFHYPLPLNSYK
jgi:hypothetical protein